MTKDDQEKLVLLGIACSIILLGLAVIGMTLILDDTEVQIDRLTDHIIATDADLTILQSKVHALGTNTTSGSAHTAHPKG